MDFGGSLGEESDGRRTGRMAVVWEDGTREGTKAGGGCGKKADESGGR